MNPKLPPGVAEARRIARNKAQNERLKKERAEVRAAQGLPPKGALTPEERREQMKIYMRGVRERQRIENAAEIAEIKAKKDAIRAKKAKLNRDLQNAKAKEKRRLDREAGKPDLRVNNGRKPIDGVKRVYIPKPKSERKSKMPPMTIKHQAKAIPTRVIDLSTCTKVRIDSKTEIYVKPGQDIEAVRAKYIAARLKL